MNTNTNLKAAIGELTTSWTSHKHPNNANFMQVVKYLHIQYSDGRNNLHWSLANASANDNHMIANISLADAQVLYSDKKEVELTENDYKEWLKNR